MGTTGGARVKNSVRCKIFQIEHKKIHIFTFGGVYVVIFGCCWVSENPACVQEITNMRYGSNYLKVDNKQCLAQILDSPGKQQNWFKSQLLQGNLGIENCQ